MQTMKITGLDRLQKTLKQAEKASQELDGEFAQISFDPSDPSSVETAINDARLAVDNRLGTWYGNGIVDQMANAAKAHFEEYVLQTVEEYNMNNPPQRPQGEPCVDLALEKVRNIITDMRRADSQSFDRHTDRLSRALRDRALEECVNELTAGLDLDAWLEAGNATQVGMVGSAKLKWPESEREELGLVILLAHRFAENQRAALEFAHTFYYSGAKFSTNLQHMVSQVFVPFERDFSAFVQRKLGVKDRSETVDRAPDYPRRVFLVHGHDSGVREAVARFLEQIDFEVIILHEQPNKGRTIIEKFEAHADAGFAVVLLTPDDYGRADKDKEEQPRARQNVILELGYFIGRLGRDRVVALKRGSVEIPSDVLGVVYTEFDDGAGWKQGLAKELEAANYQIDWKRAMSG
jgi:predicted nucleotide-binding protein